MLKLEDLDGIKLVKEENFATDSEVGTAVELGIIQGSQGWGVREEISVILKLARDLKIALALAATADENGRMLKGAQLEGGRLKKQIEKLKSDADDIRDLVTLAASRLQESQEALFDARAEVGDLKRALTAAQLDAGPIDES